MQASRNRPSRLLLCVIPPTTNVTAHVKGSLPGREAPQRLRARAGVGPITEPPSASRWPDSQTPRGKQMLSVDRVVCTESSGTVTVLIGMAGARLQPKFPDTGPGLTLQAGLSRSSSLIPFH